MKYAKAMGIHGFRVMFGLAIAIGLAMEGEEQPNYGEIVVDRIMG